MKNLRCCNRIFTEAEISIEGSLAKSRQVNISSSGIAFLLEEEFFSLSVVGDYLTIDFRVFNVKFKSVKILIVRCEKRDEKLMIGASYVSLSKEERAQLDAVIVENGGYESSDKESQKKYLEWYAPHLISNRLKS